MNCISGIQGWMSPEELKWLYTQACQMDNIVEIGSWKGRSTYALLAGCKGTVYAIDTWKGSPDELDGAHAEARTSSIYSAFMKNVGHFSNLRAIKLPSVYAVNLFADKSIDMVFIDGCHLYSHVSTDIRVWLPKARKLICGHDCGQDGVPRATQEAFGSPNITYNIWHVTL